MSAGAEIIFKKTLRYVSDRVLWVLALFQPVLKPLLVKLILTGGFALLLCVLGKPVHCNEKLKRPDVLYVVTNDWKKLPT